MTVSSSTNRAKYDGNGVTTAFPFMFKILDLDDLVVTLYDVDGNETVLAINTDYTVPSSVVGSENGGTVTMLTAPAVGEQLLLRREMELIQPTDFQNQGRFFPETHERAFDRLLMQVQELSERMGRTLTLDAQNEAVQSIPGTLDDRIGRFITFDALGNPIISLATDPAALSVTEAALLISYYNRVFRDTYADAAAIANLFPNGAVFQIADDETAPPPYTNKPYLYTKTDGVLAAVGPAEAIRVDLNVDAQDSGADLVKLFSGLTAKDVVARVPTAAALAALPVPSIANSRMPIVETLGYSVEGDGGGMKFRWQYNSSQTPDGWYVVQPSSLPATGRWIGIINEKINVLAAGFSIVNTGAQNKAAMDRATARAFAMGVGRTVYIPVGYYAPSVTASAYTCDPFILPYRVSLEGDGAPNLVESTATQPFVGTTIKLAAGSTAPLITTDKVNGPIRAASNIGVGSRRLQNSTISKIMFDGNRSNQTSPDADILQLYQVWDVTVEKCTFINARGFGIRALDCNVLEIHDNNFVGALHFYESLADSKICKNNIGGGNGHAWPCLWIADFGESAWQNTFGENIIFNNSGNAVSASFTATTDSGTDEVTTSASHNWTEATPIILFVDSGGTMPGNVTEGKTYYVHPTGATTFKLAISRANLNTGTYVNIGAAHTGTLRVQMGRNAGVYLSGSLVNWNTFKGGRVDQCYGDGFFLDGATENEIDVLVNGSGLNNATGCAGVRFRNSANRNRVIGHIYGTLVVSSGMNSNQTHGVQGDATCADNQITGRIYNHSVADIDMPLGYFINEDAEELFIASSDLKPIVSAPAAPDYALVGTSRREALRLHTAQNETGAAWLRVPRHWKYASAELLWTHIGFNSGDVNLRVQILPFGPGDTLATADTGGASVTTVAAPAQDIVSQTPIGTLGAITPGKYISLRVTRLGAVAGDTLTDSIAVLGVRLRRASA